MNINKFYALFLILGSCTVHSGEYCGSHSAMGHWVPDEFSTPMSYKSAYFGRACFAHDVCYQSRGADKSFCDAQFEQHLRYECDLAYTNAMDLPSKLACYGAAGGFTAAVRQFGDRYFERSQIEPSLLYWRP